LSINNPQYSNVYLCPVCLSAIKSDELNRISEAHIIPKAAKGNIKTFLCVDCNSQFGANQDKWFGELTKLHKEDKHLLDQELTGKHFLLNDKKLNGRWLTRENGNLAFVLNGNRNSPKDIEQFHKIVNSPKINFTIQPPILTRNYDIVKGYITAAYLYIFSFFGYAWILQNHLNTIREHILTVGQMSIDMSQFIFIEDKFEVPAIAVSFANNKLYLLFLFNNVITLLPTHTNTDLNFNLSIKDKKELVENILQLNLPSVYEQINFNFVMVGEKVLMMTDSMRQGLIKNPVGILILDDHIKLLTTQSEAEIEQLRKQKSNNIKEVNIDLTTPNVKKD